MTRRRNAKGHFVKDAPEERVTVYVPMRAEGAWVYKRGTVDLSDVEVTYNSGPQTLDVVIAQLTLDIEKEGMGV